MAKGHRSQIKKERNEVKNTKPHASAMYVRVTPTKAKIVLDQIKGKPVGQAVAILMYSPRYAAKVIIKVLQSAMANAENNLSMDVATLYVETAIANMGPMRKGIRPRAQGRAFRIEHKTSPISIVLNTK